MDGEVITLENLRQLLQIQTGLRSQAEAKAQKAQRALVSLLETFAPEEVDRRLKAGQLLDSLPVEELEQLLRQQIGIRLGQSKEKVNDNTPSRDMQALQKQIQEKQNEIIELSEQNRQLSIKVVGLENEATGMRNQIAVLQQVMKGQSQQNEKDLASSGSIQDSSAPVPAALEPAWMEEWRKSETFDRDASVLKLIGETGISRRPLIESRTAELLGIKKAGGSVQALFSRLIDLKMIEIYRPWEVDGPGPGGSFPDLLRLTEQGSLAYWMLTGKQSVKSEFDVLLSRHVSPEHTLLNLQAIDMMREAGYTVNTEPSDIHLPGGGMFKPDLVISEENGAVIYVEVEREANKDKEARQAKWRNFYQASGGNLYIFCDNRTCMRSIISEINYALGNQPMSVYLTNLADLQAGKRGEGDRIWLEVKQKDRVI